jgi:hypothetical protein
MTSFNVVRDLVFIVFTMLTGKSGITVTNYNIQNALMTIVFLLLIGVAAHNPAYAQNDTPCTIDNKNCILKQLHAFSKNIDQQGWRDQTLRELAKSYAADGRIDSAIALIAEITTPDTKAMTIRGIGMEMAGLSYSKERLDREFAKLHEQAALITHPPSHAIALTYIAMAQAFAGDNEGAWKTAGGMENDALRNKAYAETAEVQAEHGNYDAAIKSIGLIDNEAFRNKAYGTISKIFADRALLDESYQSALKISNAYNKTQAMQYMLDRQKAFERGEKPKQAETYSSGGESP